MKRKYVTKLSSLALGALLISSLVSCGSSTASTAPSGKTDADGEKAASYSIVNVSYDPTRELYVNYNEAFKKYYKDKTGNDVEITQSHGGSGKQALEVA
ncbi:MAG: sulfate ABC transporter substrate-binding protein, partial [Oscillospiraceae bacterium]|nr:sulfate ABC transporter substrate-binding protein [Oscillospiraceae bacterium]